jgi:hypothetical protein
MVVVNSWGIGTDHFGGYAGKKGHVFNVFYVSKVSTFQTFSYVSPVKRGEDRILIIKTLTRSFVISAGNIELT